MNVFFDADFNTLPVRAKVFEQFCPYRAFCCYVPKTQGVALGWGVIAPSGRKMHNYTSCITAAGIIFCILLSSCFNV